MHSVKREFNCIAFSQNEERFLFAGTTSADFIIIDHKNKCMHASISIGSLGVLQIIPLSPETILVGCGDGLLGKYTFDSKHWSLSSQLNIKQKITSLSVAKKEVLVCTSLTQSLIVNTQTFQPFLLQESHNNKIGFIRFKDGDNNLFGVASEDSTIRLWDVKSRTVKCRHAII